MNQESDTRQNTTQPNKDRAAEETIVHETVPGEDPIVTGEDLEAKKKGSHSTADEDI